VVIKRKVKNQRTEFRRGLLPKESFRRHFLKLSVEKSSRKVVEREILEVANEKKDSLLCDCGVAVVAKKKQGFCIVCSHFDVDLIP